MILALLFSFQIFADGSSSYKVLDQSCQSCVKIDSLLGKHNTELSGDKRLDLALAVSSEIRKIKLAGKPEKEQRREIYFAINGAVQVMPDDFDSDTVVKLMDLRAQSPKQFDYVFWRFNVGEQQKIVERMKVAKEDKIRSKAQIPVVKQAD
jgi:hypothetical protein